MDWGFGMVRRAGLVSLLVALVGLLLIAPSSAVVKPLPPRFVDCDEVLNGVASFRLANDMDCEGNGTQQVALRVANSHNITIDLGGHLLKGDNNVANEGDRGILLDGTDHNITIKNGTIANFDLDIDTGTSTANTFTALTVVNGQFQSVEDTGTGNTFIANTFARGASVNLDKQFAPQTDTVKANTLYGVGLVLNGSGGNTVQGNHFFGGQIDAVENGVGSASNTIDSNQITGGLFGITVSGDDSDGNHVINNTIKASSGGTDPDGVFVSDGDNNEVSRNTITGNDGNGIDLTGSATGATINSNVVSGNIANGILLAATATGASLTGNTVNNNGETGIKAASGAAPALTNNTTNFNGFVGGVQNDDNFGIDAVGGSGTGDAANGNDVLVPAVQCAGVTCTTPSSPTDAPPTLTTCNDGTVPAVVDNPLDCGATQAIHITSTQTTNLSNMAISGSPGIAIDNGLNAVKVSNANIVASTDGIDAPGITNGVFSTINVAGPTGTGISLPSGGNTNAFSAMVVTGAASGAVVLAGADSNTFSASTFAGSPGAGVTVEPNVLDPANNNIVKTSAIVGNGDNGVLIEDGDHNIVSKDDIVGNAANGVELKGTTRLASFNTLAGNTIVANALNASFSNSLHGVLIRGDASSSDPADGKGVAHSTLSGNVIKDNLGDGVHIAADLDSIKTVLASDKLLFNGGYRFGFGYGLYIESNVRQTLIHDTTSSGNAQDGIFFEDPLDGFVKDNVTNVNGFVETEPTGVPGPVSDDSGLGILIGTGAKGCGNVAHGNDDPGNLGPASLRKPC